MLLVADALLEVLPPDVDAIGGLTMGADAAAFGTAAIAATRGRMLRAFSVRKEEKDHGAGGRIAYSDAAGAKTVDGLAMFVRQAGTQFKQWTGQALPVALVHVIFE